MAHLSGQEQKCLHPPLMRAGEANDVLGEGVKQQHFVKDEPTGASAKASVSYSKPIYIS